MDSVVGPLLLQAILILLNAFFASTELAVLSLNESRLRASASEGDGKAKKLLGMLNNPASFLSAIQIGITLAGFMGSAFAADNFSDPIVSWLIGLGVGISAKALDTLVVIAITLVLSLFTLVFGELVPKRLAMKSPDKIARFACGIVSALSVVLKPVIWLLSAATNGVLRLFGVNPNDEEAPVSAEDIMLMIDEGEEKGTIDPGEKELIDNVFGFSDLTAADIMVHRTDMEIIYADEPGEQIIDTIRRTGYSRFPVCGESPDDIRGILIAKKYLLDGGSGSPEALAIPAVFVPETVSAAKLLCEMRRDRSHMAIVCDEYGGTSGLVTIEDLIEEIVGEIYDESEHAAPSITGVEGGSCVVRGEVKLEDAAHALGADICESESETVGGLIYGSLSRIPADGEQPETVVGNFKLKAEKIVGRRIELARVSLVSRAAAPDNMITDKV